MEPVTIGSLFTLLGVALTALVNFLLNRKKDSQTHLRETTNAEHQKLVDENERIVGERDHNWQLYKDTFGERERYRRLYEHAEARVSILERTLYSAGMSLPSYPPHPYPTTPENPPT